MSKILWFDNEVTLPCGSIGKVDFVGIRCQICLKIWGHSDCPCSAKDFEVKPELENTSSVVYNNSSESK